VLERGQKSMQQFIETLRRNLIKEQVTMPMGMAEFLSLAIINQSSKGNKNSRRKRSRIYPSNCCKCQQHVAKSRKNSEK